MGSEATCRRRHDRLVSSNAGALSIDPKTGLPLVSVGRVVTSEDVRFL
jgi:hypothetical protein